MLQHRPHPHKLKRAKQGPITRRKAANTFNERVALNTTTLVGTMACAYVFAFITLPGLPAALHQSSPSNPLAIIQWFSQSFAQFVLLPIIIVGQNIESKAANQRAEQIFNDVEMIMHELEPIKKQLNIVTAEDKR